MLLKETFWVFLSTKYFSIFREKNLDIVCYTSIWLEDTQYKIFTIYR